ncbi:UvrD-helicase domain-containing protein, partial [Kineococcus sp. T13]|uniref:UvrD-helicase domain-containing protein n=1 Tax=Kineococcus vitellinus TaxID=2696565 RepID=UPI0014129636|nr:UvrD-helicase domain-containing protein [Kineococcus vitellinus]
MLRENADDHRADAPGDPGRPGDRPRLLRAPARVPAPLQPDPAQRAARERPRGSGPLVVLGAPGSGRTTTLREVVAARVERDGTPADRVLVLAPSRRQAEALRDELSLRLLRTSSEPAARTPESYAFGLLRLLHAREGAPAPRLITAAEQDAVLADLLRGHREAAAPRADPADGPGEPWEPEPEPEVAPAVPGWPADLPPGARELRGFRDELRELLVRAVEHGLGPAELAELGRRHGRPQWGAAGRVLEEYQAVTALGRAGAHDPAGLLEEAAARLRASPRLLAAERERWDLVAVDDAHELSEAALRLLEVVAGGRDLLLTADPDSVTRVFRGADPRAAADLAARFGARGVPADAVVLGTLWRQPPDLHAVS